MKNKKDVVFLLLPLISMSFFLIHSSCSTLIWENTYGSETSERGLSIIEDFEGNYVIAGISETYPGSGAVVYLLKINRSGNLIWEKKYNQGGAFSLTKSDNNEYVVAGVNIDGAYIIKVDSKGELVWEKTIGPNTKIARSIIKVNGGYVFTGSIRNNDRGDQDVYLLKINDTGNIIWEKSIGGPENEEAYSIIEARDGNYLISGGVESSDSSGNVLIMLIDSDGNLIWKKNYGGNEFDWAHSSTIAHEYGYVIAGSTNSYGNGQSVYCLKIKENGELIWNKTYTGTKDETAFSISSTSDSNYILVGRTESYNAQQEDVYVIKINEKGELLWHQVINKASENIAQSVITSSDGGYVFCGSSWVSGNGHDVLVSEIVDLGVAASPVTQSKNIIYGESSDFIFEIKNTGAIDDAYSLISNDYGGLSINETYILKPEESIQTTISFDQLDPGDYTNQITIVSKINPLINTTITIILSVIDYGVALSPHESTQNVLESQNIVHVFSIMNTGSHTDTFSLKYSDDLVPIISTNYVTLEPGEKTDISVIYEGVPSASQPYEGTLIVTSENDLQSSDEKAQDSSKLIINVLKVQKQAEEETETSEEEPNNENLIPVSNLFIILGVFLAWLFRYEKDKI